MFEFHTAESGRLVVEALTGGHMLDIEELLTHRKQTSPSELIDIFIASLTKTEDGKRLTPDQIKSLSDAEKEDFAEKLVQAEDDMYRESIKETHKNDKGEIVLEFRKGDVILPRDDKEPASAYFYRVYTNYKSEMAKRFASAFALPTGLAQSVMGLTGWAKPSALDALVRNATLSDSLSKNLAAVRTLGTSPLESWNASLKGSSLERFRSGLRDQATDDDDSTSPERAATSLGAASDDLYRNLRNPVVDTNERLDTLIVRFDKFEGIAVQTVELVQSMNDAALGLLQSFAEGAKSTERFARRSIWIAGMALSVAILMPLFQIGYDIRKSHQHDGDTQAIVQEVVHQVTASQQQTANEIRDALTSQSAHTHTDQAELAKVIAAASDALRALKGQSPQLQIETPASTPSEPARHIGN
jgi:hypothetical protein